MSYDTYVDGELALDLVNTWDASDDRPELLPDVPALARFLARHDLPEDVGPADLGSFHALRDQLRAAFSSGSVEAFVAHVDALARGLRAAPALQERDSGTWRLGVVPLPGAPPAERYAVAAVSGLAETIELHGAGRLRTCAASPCWDAFLDTSRNGSRRYCSARCANRHNAARYRARQRG